MTHLGRPTPRKPTQAAEGLPRWRWTVAEFDRFIEMGIFTEADRVELIGGEIIPMSPKRNRHELLRSELQNSLFRALPSTVKFFTETAWRPDEETYVEPDIVLASNKAYAPEFQPSHVLLLIEIADTSLSYDLDVKAKLYAELVVTEYWVIDARALETHVYREPAEGLYQAIDRHAAVDALTPLALPAVKVCLANLGLKPE